MPVNYHRPLSRRLFLAGASSLALSGCGPSSCILDPATIDITATSALYLLKFIRDVLANYMGSLLASHLDPAEFMRMAFSSTTQPSPEKIDFNAVVDKAQRVGIDIGLAVKLAKEIGSDAFIKAVDSGLPLLPKERDKSVQPPVNAFRVEVRNPTHSDIGGQFLFAIVDPKTDQQEGADFGTDSFLVRSGENRIIAYLIDDDFQTPGVKRIIIKDWPVGIVAKATDVMVLPVRAMMNN